MRDIYPFVSARVKVTEGWFSLSSLYFWLGLDSRWTREIEIAFEGSSKVCEDDTCLESNDLLVVLWSLVDLLNEAADDNLFYEKEDKCLFEE